MNQHIQSNVQDPVFSPPKEVEPRIQQVPLPVEHQTMRVDEALQSKMMEWATDDDEDEEEPVLEEPQILEEHIEIQAKPRTPQRMVRKRRSTAKPNKRHSIDAAVNRDITLPSLQETDSSQARPFVPLATPKEHVFPPTRHHLNQREMKQAAAVHSSKKRASFPPIKATGHVPIAMSKSEQEKVSVKKSPHAREHAASPQRLQDDNSEGNA